MYTYHIWNTYHIHIYIVHHVYVYILHHIYICKCTCCISRAEREGERSGCMERERGKMCMCIYVHRCLHIRIYIEHIHSVYTAIHIAHVYSCEFLGICCRIFRERLENLERKGSVWDLHAARYQGWATPMTWAERRFSVDNPISRPIRVWQQ